MKTTLNKLQLENSHCIDGIVFVMTSMKKGVRRFGPRTVSAQLIVGFGQEKTTKQAIP